MKASVSNQKAGNGLAASMARPINIHHVPALAPLTSSSPALAQPLIRPPQRTQATSITQEAPSAVVTGSSWVSKEARHAMFARGKEQIEPIQAAITGQLPSWLEGELVTNGAGYYEGMTHLFDGEAMVAKLSISNGQVKASQRFIETQQWQSIKRTGKMKWREFATELPAKDMMEKVGQVAENLLVLATNGDGTTDNASVSLVPLPDGSLLALSEALTAVYRLNGDDMSTIGQVKFNDGLPGQLITAHPKLLPGGKQLVNFSHSIPGGGFHVHIQDLITLKRKQIAYFPDANPLAPAWVHDFSITENYGVIVENPIVFNMKSLVFGGATDYLFMDWVPEQKTRVHVCKLDGSEAKTYLAPAFFTFHHANAFEAGGMLHVDMGAYDGPKVLNDLSLEPMQTFPGKNISQSHLRRLSIPLSSPSGTEIAAPRPLIKDESSYGGFCEFPGCSSAVKTKPYRYAYSLSAVRPSNMGNAVAKHDIQTGTSQVWHEPGCAPGEPVFVPSPQSQSEDDGVVLVPMMGSDGKSFLLVLDGRSFKEIGRAILPYAIPYRFHGTWIPKGQKK